MGFITRYFDGIVTSLFKQRPDGRTVFMPAGVFSKGRLIPDASTEAQLRSKVRWAYIVLFAVLIPLVVGVGGSFGFGDLSTLRGTLTTIGLATLIGLLFNLYFFQLARGLEKTDDRLTWSEAYATQAKTLGQGWIIALLLISMALMSAGVFLLVDGGASLFWPSLFTIVLFGGCFIVFARQLLMLRRNR